MAKLVTDEILSLLREGRALAARVAVNQCDWSAWVYILPIMRGGRTLSQAREEWTRERLATPFDGTIEYFNVRRVELYNWHLDDSRFFDLDDAIRERPITDIQQRADSQAALEEWLQKNGVERDSLADPAMVGYPYPPVSRRRGREG